MTTIEAIYEDGVFKPVRPVELPDHQPVRLQVTPVAPVRPEDFPEWFAALKRRHDEWLATRPPLPDSTPDNAEDRRRDV